MRISNTGKAAIVARVTEWLETMETTDACNNDGGELVGELKLTCLNSGTSSRLVNLDQSYTIVVNEKLAEEIHY